MKPFSQSCIGLTRREALRLRIREIAQTRVRYGYRKIRVLLNREGWKVGKKLVYRLYREEVSNKAAFHKKQCLTFCHHARQVLSSRCRTIGVRLVSTGK